MKNHLLCCAAALALIACSNEASAPEMDAPLADAPGAAADAPAADTTPDATADTGPELGSFGIETADMDASVAPGDDFYRHVGGKWLDTFEIPAEFSNYGSFTKLFERSEERVRAIIEEAAQAGASASPVEAKIGDFYAAFMDEDAIEAAGLAPLQDQLDAYDALRTHDDVASAFADVGLASNAPIGLYVDVDSKQTDQYAVYMTQSGLGLPNRDYYLKDEFADKTQGYKALLTGLLAAAGEEDAPAKADQVYALEKRLAEAHWAPAKQRDRDLTYNPYTVEELAAYAPQMPWASMMDDLGIASAGRVIVRENDAVQAMATVFEETPVEVWSDYLVAHALIEHASVLPARIDDAVYDFYGRQLRGTEAQRERWKRGVSAVSSAMGEAVGEVYVDRHFPADSKRQMEDLVGNLTTAFEGRLDKLDWMTDETKAEAQEKLASFTTKIGYPDAWTDYSGLDVSSDDPVANMRAASRFAFEEMTSKLGGPIDTAEWFMTPQTVNAYYSPNRNEIVFPAAILQAPFFDPAADPAVNYGGIGAVIGHEIGHGFDDQGRKSDGTGALRDWWTKADASAFDERADRLGAQYASYEPIEGMPLDPELTMGENIGDLGGLTMAYEAYKLSLGGEEAPVLDGMTGDQRFFAAWAQVWKRLYREDELRNRIATDPHSPSAYRVNGVVRNMDAWYEAFEVAEDDALYLPEDERVRIW